MKVFITTAVWGKSYIDIFAKYSLSSLYAPGNLPTIIKDHEITLHISTTKKDLMILKSYQIFRIIEKSAICLDIDFIDEITNEKNPPIGVGGRKYKFLTSLQNHAIEKSKQHDLIIFNYSDFVWGDSSIGNMIKKCENGIDSVLGFCLPVDLNKCNLTLSRSTNDNGILSISNQESSRVAVNAMHREAMLRYWDSPVFTTTPTYLMWKVGSEGVVLRAYHQTVLALKTQVFNEGFEKNEGSSLDGYYSTLIVKKGNFEVATDSSQVSVFSLYETVIDSRLIKWKTKKESMYECLRSIVTIEHRKLAEKYPILIKTTEITNPLLWDEMISQSSKVLTEMHRAVSFDQIAHNLLYLQSDPVETLYSSDLSIQFINLIRRVIIKLGISEANYEKIVLLKKWLIDHDGISRKRLLLVFLGVLKKYKILGIYSEILIGKYFPRLHNKIFIYLAFESQVDQMSTRIMVKKINDLKDAGEVNNLKEIVDCYSKNLSKIYPFINSTGFNFYKLLGEFNHIAGFIDDSKAAFFKSEQIRIQLLNNVLLTTNTNIIFPADSLSSIGVIGHFDSFIKYKKKFKPELKYSVIGDSGASANEAFLGLFEDQINISSKTLFLSNLGKNDYLFRNDRLIELLTVNWHWYCPNIEGDHCNQVFLHKFIQDLNKFEDGEAHNSQEIQEFLTMHQEYFEQLLYEIKIKKNERYVCIHIRTSSYWGASHGEKMDSFRNPSILTYVPMIAKICENSKVVLMGDEMDELSLSPLKHLIESGRVINYPKSVHKKALNDILLIANCEYFIASPSGLYAVSSYFGKSTYLVDYPAYEGIPWKKNHRMLPLHYFDKSSLSYINNNQLYKYGMLTHGPAFEKNNIETHFNTSTEILAGYEKFLKSISRENVF